MNVGRAWFLRGLGLAPLATMLSRIPLPAQRTGFIVAEWNESVGIQTYRGTNVFLHIDGEGMAPTASYWFNSGNVVRDISECLAYCTNRGWAWMQASVTDAAVHAAERAITEAAR